MTALIILLTVIAFSLLTTRVAARALVLTGISEEMAHFQARSAFSGAGFTTDEAEHVVNHPVRRRIILTLMLLGNAGLATAISTFVLSFMGSGTTAGTVQRGLVLVSGLLVLAVLAKNRHVSRYLDRLIERGLDRFTDLRVVDYRTMLHLGEGYGVSRLTVREGTWLANETLQELSLAQEGILVLCIETDVGRDCAPHSDHEIYPGDTLVLYGRREALTDLSERLADTSGEQAHEQAKRAYRHQMAAKEKGTETEE